MKKIEIKKEKEETKKKLNYKSNLIALSLLECSFIILTFIFAFSIENDPLFWLFLVLTIVSSIVLIGFIFIKIKSNKNEELSEE